MARKANHKFLTTISAVVLLLGAAWLLAGSRLNSATPENYQSSDTFSSTYQSSQSSDDEVAPNNIEKTKKVDIIPTEEYAVEYVVDGDTFKITYDGQLTSVRIIGINTPETIDPRKSVECFGQEASDYLKARLSGQTVKLASDPTQTDRDKYGRLLRYVYLNGQDIGLEMIQKGYGFEYTYDIPYQNQINYKQAQEEATANQVGLWASDTCVKPQTTAPTPTPAAQNHVTDNNSSNAPNNSSIDTANCQIKGNINSSGEHIYHLPGQRFYNRTQIDTNTGERWFCSENEALRAGWRKSKV